MATLLGWSLAAFVVAIAASTGFAGAASADPCGAVSSHDEGVARPLSTLAQPEEKERGNGRTETPRAEEQVQRGGDVRVQAAGKAGSAATDVTPPGRPEKAPDQAPVPTRDLPPPQPEGRTQAAAPDPAPTPTRDSPRDGKPVTQRDQQVDERPAAGAGPTPTATPPRHRPAGTVDVDPGKVSGSTDDGKAVRVTGGEVRIAGPGEEMALPVAVARGASLNDMADEGSGLVLRTESVVNPKTGQVERDRTFVQVPVTDGPDGAKASIRAVLAARPAGTGETATARVERLELRTPRREADMSAAGGRATKAAVTVAADLRAVPANAALRISMTPAPDASASERIAQIAAQGQMAIVEMAFAVDLAKSPELSAAVGPATLDLEVDRAWVQAVGLGAVRVFRVADDGTPQVLTPAALDPEADPVVFRVLSPLGLSVFALAAVRDTTVTPAATPTPTATPMRIVFIPAATATPAPGRTPTPSIAATPRPAGTPTPTVDEESGGGMDPALLIGVAALVVVGASAAGYLTLRPRIR